MNSSAALFVTGTGTGVGKTLVSAILVRALHADYWKPVQAGLGADGAFESDTATVERLAGGGPGILHPEQYRLQEAASPHAAAAAQGILISLDSLAPPRTDRLLVVEGSGGVLAPLSDKLLIIDLVKALKASVIVVVRSYLGCINHSLLTLESLAHRRIPVAGIVLNGDFPNPSVEAILGFGQVPLIGCIREESKIDRRLIDDYATHFRENLAELNVVCG